MDRLRGKHNQAQRIEAIRRTLRRQSVSQSSVAKQPPPHSIMAGFAGFVNLTTATCNTGALNEDRMSIPLIEQTSDSKSPTVSRKSKKTVSYSKFPRVSSSQVKQNESLAGSDSSSSASSGTGIVARLRTRWSDPNVIDSHGNQIKVDAKGHDGTTSKISKKVSPLGKQHYTHYISSNVQSIREDFESSNIGISTTMRCKPPRMPGVRRDSVATAYNFTANEIEADMLMQEAAASGRHASVPHIINITGQSMASSIQSIKEEKESSNVDLSSTVNCKKAPRRPQITLHREALLKSAYHSPYAPVRPS